MKATFTLPRTGFPKRARLLRIKSTFLEYVGSSSEEKFRRSTDSPNIKYVISHKSLLSINEAGYYWESSARKDELHIKALILKY